MARKFLLTVAVIALLLGAGGYLLLAPQSPLYYNPQASSSGIHLKGCLYDSSGNEIGCNSAFKVPIGQSVTGAGGASIASIRIPSAYATLNYTGTPTSISLTATEQVSYAKGVGESFAVSYSSASPVKSFNITLPKSSWTAGELEAKWGTSYGTKLVNITLVNPTLTVKFSNGITITKPSAFNYQVRFTLNYGQSTTTSTSTSTSTTIGTTTTTQTSTSTTISGGEVSSGTTDIWTTTVTSASSGNGNLAVNGIIVNVQPYQVQSGFAIAWVYIPSGYSLPPCDSGTCGQATIVTKSVSMGAFGLRFQAGAWTQASIPVGVAAGDLILAQLSYSNQQIYNQAFTVSQPTTLPELGAFQVPAAPFTSQWQTQSCASGAISEGTCAVWFPSLYATQTTTATSASASTQTPACYGYQGIPIYSQYICNKAQLSVVSVTF